MPFAWKPSFHHHFSSLFSSAFNWLTSAHTHLIPFHHPHPIPSSISRVVFSSLPN
ncbi:hypothetical protein TYRP_009439 [Tyrophagus putrescentiae]|nr:hypothetical protein TYRP_009439 [Tyrophagus putrescentiae]